MNRSILLLLVFLGVGTAPVGAALVGHWTFESGSTADITGNFGNLVLEGGATISGGALKVSGSGTTATGWARTPPAGGGVAIGSKTLVSWITLEDLGAMAAGGSALTLDSISTDKFDGIVFAELNPNRWMSGSNSYARSPSSQFDQTGISVESTIGDIVQLAVTYENIGGTARITGYRNGLIMGNYDFGPFANWAAGDQEVVFGKRHILSQSDIPGALNALIHEARIYDTVLSQSEIQALQMIPEPTTPLLVAIFGALSLCRRQRASSAARS